MPAYHTSDIHIKQIEVGAQPYDVSAVHFLYSVNGLTLDIAQDWKEYIDSQVAGNAKIQIILPPNNTLPTASADTLGKIYLISTGTAEAGTYAEWVTIESIVQWCGGSTHEYTWEKIGTTSADLTEYATKTDINTVLGSVHTTAPSSSLTSVNGASSVTVAAGGSQTATGVATEVLQDIITSKSSSISVTGLAFSGTSVTVPNSSYTFSGHTSVLPKGSISGSATIGDHTHVVLRTMRTVYSTVTAGDSVQVATGITATRTNVATGVTKSTMSALFNLNVSTDGVLHFNTTPVLTAAGVNTSAAVNSVSVKTKSSVLSNVNTNTVNVVYNAAITSPGGGYTVYGNKFSFAGSVMAIAHTAGSSADFDRTLTMTGGTYTAAGALVGPQIAGHTHKIAAGSFSLDDDKVAVAVAITNHTHTFSGNETDKLQHSHAMGHTHDITFSTL